jgi:CheY-like chemotaxis protein
MSKSGSGSAWQVLVVDDDPDVHSITTIALKRRRWKGKGVQLTSAHSAAEARTILESPESPRFHVALLDVVMETKHAGLELCEYVRQTMAPDLRIVLRTGQAGIAPEEKVLNEYDIDFYLAKSELTEQRLYTTVRGCFRSSQDISTLLMLDEQLRSLTSAVQSAGAPASLLDDIMAKSLAFLEEKYSAEIVLATSADAPESRPEPLEFNRAGVATALVEAIKRELPFSELSQAGELGLADDVYLLRLEPLVTSRRDTEPKGVRGWIRTLLGSDTHRPADAVLGVRFAAPPLASTRLELKRDVALFTGNWRIAESLLIFESWVGDVRPLSSDLAPWKKSI